MSDRSAETDSMRLAASADVDVVVEVARFTLTVAELSQVRVGEVLVSGRRIGDLVTIRVGDRAMATGELVDVDGEVGVRLLRIG